MNGQNIGYVRVSTPFQNPDRQLEGIQLHKIFSETISGKVLHRPVLQELIEYIREGDTLVVHSMDRLARNLDHLRNIVQQLIAKKVKIHFVKENLIFNGDHSPLSILMLSVMGAFAEFEKSLLQERQREGIAMAKINGKYKGRKKALNDEKIKQLHDAMSTRESKTAIAKRLGISRHTIYRYLSPS